MLNSLINTLKESKTIISGIAILLIVLCNLEVVCKDYAILKIFTPGFIGVDFFMFYSGYSLGYSFHNRGLCDFYIQRIKRIYPIFVVFAILFSFVYVSKGVSMSAYDWFCNLTTLSYYGVGGFPIDWYLSSLFLFYLSYPVLYLITSKLRWGTAPIFAMLTTAIILFSDLHDYYGSAIARIPIFILGLTFYIFRDNENIIVRYLQISLAFLVILLLGIYGGHMGYHFHGYILLDLIAPLAMLIIVFVIFVCFNKKNKIVSTVELFGKKSLEIYIANYLTMVFCKLYLQNLGGTIILIYITLNILIAFALVYVNRGLTAIINTNLVKNS